MGGVEQPSEPFLASGTLGMRQGCTRCTALLQLRRCTALLQLRAGRGSAVQESSRSQTQVKSDWLKTHQPHPALVTLALIPPQSRLPGWTIASYLVHSCTLRGVSLAHFYAVEQNRNSSPASGKNSLQESSPFVRMVTELSLRCAVP